MAVFVFLQMMLQRGCMQDIANRYEGQNILVISHGEVELLDEAS